MLGVGSARGKGNSQCKGPEVHIILVCLEKSKVAGAAGGKWVRVRVGGGRVGEWEEVRAGDDRHCVQGLVGHRKDLDVHSE